MHNPYADGVAAVLIGLLLTAVAGALARQSKRLLLGQGTKPAALRHLAALTGADPAVVRARRIATMYLGPEEVTLLQSVVFRAGLTTADLSQAIVRIQTARKAAYPVIKHAYRQPLGTRGGRRFAGRLT